MIFGTRPDFNCIKVEVQRPIIIVTFSSESQSASATRYVSGILLPLQETRKKFHVVPISAREHCSQEEFYYN